MKLAENQPSAGRAPREKLSCVASFVIPAHAGIHTSKLGVPCSILDIPSPLRSQESTLPNWAFLVRYWTFLPPSARRNPHFQIGRSLLDIRHSIRYPHPRTNRQSKFENFLFFPLTNLTHCAIRYIIASVIQRLKINIHTRLYRRMTEREEAASACRIRRFMLFPPRNRFCLTGGRLGAAGYVY